MNAIPLQHLDIYEFFCDPDLIDKVMPEVTGPDILWQKFADPGPTMHPTLSRHGYLDEKTSYYNPELFTWIQECVDKVAEKHYGNLKLSIVDSWLTKNQLGDRPNNHAHNYSVISGLLYFSTFKNSKTIFKYKDPWFNHLPMVDPIRKEVPIASEKGKLILWRSDIVHTVEPHSDMKNTRYTLAFNTFFDDVISDYDTARLQVKVISVKDQYEKFMKNKGSQ